MGRYFLPERNQRRAARALPGARRIAYSSEEEEDVPPEGSAKNLKWRDREQRIFKYIDDNLQINRVSMEHAERSTEGGINVRTKHGLACQNTFRRIIRRAEDRGMKVNSGKTAMVCVSDA